MNIAIVGGTGTVGAVTARELTARGHDVRVLSRHAPEYPVDLTDGSGLARALAGVAHHVGVSIIGADRARTFASSARLGVLPSVHAPLQPVDPREVGLVLADTAEAEPSLAITQFAGPEVVSAR